MSRKIQLKEKGWSDQEIKSAEVVLERAERYDIHFSKIVFWSALVVIIFANLVISLILIPFLIVLNQEVLYLFVVIMGGTIGFLYNFLITNIGHLERKHHLWAGIIVPVITLINMVVVVMISNKFITDVQATNPPHNPWIIAVVFAAAFIFPYLLSRIRNTFSEKKVVTE